MAGDTKQNSQQQTKLLIRFPIDWPSFYSLLLLPLPPLAVVEVVGLGLFPENQPFCCVCAGDLFACRARCTYFGRRGFLALLAWLQREKRRPVNKHNEMRKHTRALSCRRSRRRSRRLKTLNEERDEWLARQIRKG